MFNIYVLGTNYKTLSVEKREHFAFSALEQNTLLQKITSIHSVSEAALLSTCNRTEIICISYDQNKDLKRNVWQLISDEEDVSEGFYFLENAQAIEHIFRVICSLESMVLGEQDIYRQFKRSYLAAQEANTAGKALERLFQQAFKLGKRCRTETEIGYGNVSVPQTALRLAERELDSLKGKRVLVVGAGEMAQKLVNLLSLKELDELCISNRSFEKAKELAVLNDGSTLAFNDIAKEFHSFDAVFFALYSPKVILNSEHLEQAKTATLCVDISVPRVIENAENQSLVQVYSVDDLQSILTQNIARREKAVPRVEELIEQVKNAFVKWKNEFHILPTVIDLNQKIKELCETEVAKNQKFFPEASHNHLRSFARILSSRIIGMPIDQIKQVNDKEQQIEHLEALREMFNLSEVNK